MPDRNCAALADTALADTALADTALADTAPTDVVLAPATRLLWRSPESIHLELGRRAVVVDGLPPDVVSDIAGRERPEPGRRPGDPALPRALAALAEAGYLWERGPREDPRLLPPVPRLAGQLTSLTPRHGEAAAAVLATRRRASVEVGGRGRAVASVAALLAAAGVGRVHCSVEGTARLEHAVPGGVTVADEGRPLAAAAEAAVRRTAPEVDTSPLPPDQHADLTILVSEAPIPDDRPAALHAAGAAHLAVVFGTESGSVGPLVVPGFTSCLACAELHRRDRDPNWDSLAVQLAIDPRYGRAVDVTVVAILAGVAAHQALAFLDGETPATIEGTLELELPDWRLRRRSRLRHPSCECAGAA